MSTAVEKESRRRLAAFLNNVEAYRDYPYQRRLTETAAAARVGSSQLLEFPANGTDNETAILVVPSLIKRAYVLNLAEGHSFMRRLSANGVDGYVVNWGVRATPSETSN